VFAFLAVLVTLGDPGITIDEPLDVRPGRTYVQTLLRRGPAFFEPRIVRAVFADNAEHPPLGRWLLGIASTLGEPLESLLGGADVYSVHAGRLAPAAAFAILVGLVATTTGRRYGQAAGLAAGASLVLMPRMFAHAHLAALDTLVALTWTAALLATDRAVGSTRPTLAMLGAGAVWGLALLTKIHGWLLPPLVGLYALARLGPRRAVLPVLAWTGVGVLIFWAGWPWLWYDTWDRLRAYFGTGVERLTLYALYFGEVHADRDVPWHYPWVHFAVTVPVGLHLLGVVGAWRAWVERGTDGLPLRLLGAILLLLVIFSTRVPVYDGERLFLAAFPLWAILIGRGFAVLWQRWSHWGPRAAWVALFLAQGYGTVALHPFGLSYYNALVGGLPGAERLGLELTYWSDTIDRRLLDELARVARPGDSAALVPTLHHIQPAATMTPSLLAGKVALRPQEAIDSADWLVVSRRTAYWPPGLADHLNRTPPVAVRSRQGVWLAGLWPGPRQGPTARSGELRPADESTTIPSHGPEPLRAPPSWPN
jgi:4-amino-4-deoxy-L-arabinose transferase-like glycosyltransferase